jgi:general transcriptional corepressor CYC8
MALRHMTRPSERERHLEPSSSSSHPIPHTMMVHPPHPPPHINGNAPIPNPGPPLAGGSAHGPAIVSPTAVPTGAPNGQPAAAPPPTAVHKLALANEQTWLLIGTGEGIIIIIIIIIGSRSPGLIAPTGRIAEQMGDLEHAQSAYENALRHNPMSLSGLTQVAGIARIKENYPMVS